LLTIQGEVAAGLGDEGGRRRRFAGPRGQRHKRRADHPQRKRGAWAGQRSQAHGGIPIEGRISVGQDDGQPTDLAVESCRTFIARAISAVPLADEVIE